jgi:hypothetical protein
VTGMITTMIALVTEITTTTSTKLQGRLVLEGRS